MLSLDPPPSPLSLPTYVSLHSERRLIGAALKAEWCGERATALFRRPAPDIPPPKSWRLRLLYSSHLTPEGSVCICKCNEIRTVETHLVTISCLCISVSMCVSLSSGLLWQRHHPFSLLSAPPPNLSSSLPSLPITRALILKNCPF